MSKPAAAPLSLARILAFSGVSLPLGAIAVAMSVYLPRYFAGHVGVSLAAVGAVFATVRMIDIPVDPALGFLMDRTRSRFGRYRLWIGIGAPLLLVALYMLFMAPEGVSSGYLIAWLLVYYLGTSILGLAHSAWAATLATEYDQRSRLFGVLAAVGVVGAVLVLAVPIIAEQMHRTEAQGVQAMGWFIIATIPVCIGVVIWRTPETLTKDHSHHFRWRDYTDLLIRPSVLRLMAADLCVALGPGWMSALYLFFFKDSRGFTTGEATALLGVYIIAGFFGAPSIGRLAMRLGKHRSLMITTTIYSLGLITLMAVPKGSFIWALPVMFTCGFMAAGFNLLIRAMTADVGDEVRLAQGRERIGLLYALTTSTSKIAGALSIGLTFFVLSKVGYDATDGAVNTPEAIRSLEWAYLVGPIVFVMLGGACFIGYKLDARRHGEIRAELERRDAQANGVQFDEAPIIESVSAEPSIVSPPEPKPG